jgi:hypothetical protein
MPNRGSCLLVWSEWSPPTCMPPNGRPGSRGRGLVARGWGREGRESAHTAQQPGGVPRRGQGVVGVAAWGWWPSSVARFVSRVPRPLVDIKYGSRRAKTSRSSAPMASPYRATFSTPARSTARLHAPSKHGVPRNLTRTLHTRELGAAHGTPEPFLHTPRPLFSASYSPTRAGTHTLNLVARDSVTPGAT